MGDTEESNTRMMQRFQSSFGSCLPSIQKQQFSINQLEVPQLNAAQTHAPMRQFSSIFSREGSGNSAKRVGIPPSHPNQIPPLSPFSQILVSRPNPQQMGGQGFTPSRLTHTRSLTQPSCFSFDSLPPLSPFSYRDSSSQLASDLASSNVSMENRDGSSHLGLPPPTFRSGSGGGIGRRGLSNVGESLPPRKALKRSNSDISFGFSSFIQSSPSLAPIMIPSTLERSVAIGENPVQLVKESSWERGGSSSMEGMGNRKFEGEVVDNLLSAYMNSENSDVLNSSGIYGKISTKHLEDLDSKECGTKTTRANSNDNEAESSINESGSSGQRVAMSGSFEKREGIKRSVGGDIAPTTIHYRSISMDSSMGKLKFGDESLKFPSSLGPSPSHQLSPSNSMDGNIATFNLQFANGEFTKAEFKKIMANEKLIEIALTDPKRAKRILANRQSAARSKERKTQYISELEHKVQSLQSAATTMSTQLKLLQRDFDALKSQNNDLKFHLQAMKQQAQLQDALNEALSVEVQRLKLATTELSSKSAQSMISRLSLNPQMFQMHPHQANMQQSHQQP